MTVGVVEVIHGSESTYFNYSCRCGPCYEEHSRSESRRNKRRQREHSRNGAKGHA